MACRHGPGVPFERYADDVILHSNSEPRARVVLDAIVKRLAILGHLRGSLSLADLARQVNPVVRGWINYYGRFHSTELL